MLWFTRKLRGVILQDLFAFPTAIVTKALVSYYLLKTCQAAERFVEAASLNCCFFGQKASDSVFLSHRHDVYDRLGNKIL